MSTAGSARGRGRVRGRGRASVTPSPPAVALGDRPANRSGAVFPYMYSGHLPRSNQVHPLPIMAPLLSSTNGTATVQQDAAGGATRLVSPSPWPVVPEAAPDLDLLNYANTRHRFGNYLQANRDYYWKQALEASGPCRIQVSFHDMVKLKAPSSVITATTSCVRQNNLHASLIPAAQDFLRQNGWLNEDTGSNQPCISFSGFPESIQNAQEYIQTNGPLVQRVSVCGGKSSVTTLTDNGSIFTEALIGGILKHHSQGTSWGGTYSANDIHIIKWESRSHRYNHEPYSYEMKILQNPVGDTGRSLDEAMARDLRRAAEIIFTPVLFELQDGWPAHLLELKEELQGAKQVSVRKACFIKSLSQHPAIMPSSDRVSLLTKLDRERYSLCDIMLDPPTAYPNGWKTVMQSAIVAEKQADKDGISLLETFYNKDNRLGHKYDETAGALVRFIRNIIVHATQYRQCELEWYFAKIFSRFLPSIAQTLLDTGRMEQL